MTCNDAIEIWNSLRVAMSSSIVWGMLSFLGALLLCCLVNRAREQLCSS